jgi:hypothetical protein
MVNPCGHTIRASLSDASGPRRAVRSKSHKVNSIRMGVYAPCEPISMRLLRTINTPWTPYSVMFSRDGNRIAIGGGAWYGDGGIILANVSTGEMERVSCGSEGPTISAVFFSEDDRHLVASTWSSRQHGGPILFFEVSDTKLAHAASVTNKEEGYSCPTGVLLYGKHTIIRNHGPVSTSVITILESPPELGIKAASLDQHLTNSHVVMVKERAITGGRGLQSTPWPARGDWLEAQLVRESGGTAQEGLVSVPLHAGLSGAEFIPVIGRRQITAITATPAADSFVTGGLDGELDKWSWNGRWEPKQLQAKTENREIHVPGIIWATYECNSIIGICYLCDVERWVTVTAGGKITVMLGNTSLGSWQLPKRGSPRSIAAHPTENWIAIGTKQGGFDNPNGVVQLIEIGSRGLM